MKPLVLEIPTYLKIGHPLWTFPSVILSFIKTHFPWTNWRAKYIYWFLFTLKDARGGGSKWPAGQENVCHFSHGNAMITKNLDFIHKYSNWKIKVRLSQNEFMKSSILQNSNRKIWRISALKSKKCRKQNKGTFLWYTT
jgi:hypothetical protein